MFPKIITSKGRQYLHIVESYRNDKGVPAHKSICSLGRVEDLFKNNKFKAFLKALSRLAGQDNKLYDIQSVKEQSRVYWGVVAIIRKLWDSFDLDRLLSKFTKSSKVKFDFYEAIFLMLADRFALPSSKRHTFLSQDKYGTLNKVPLHQFYRALDLLAENKDNIEHALLVKNCNSFKMGVQVVFYDVTTLYFESVHPDDLRKFGYSKDSKSREVQVTVGLLLSTDGRPVGYEVFPGNFYEGKTLLDAINKLKNKFKINKLIFIADQGMLSADNISAISSSGYEYIIGGRIKNKPDKIKEDILDLSSYENVPSEKGILKIKVLDCCDKDKILELKRINFSKENMREIKKLTDELVNNVLAEKIKKNILPKLGDLDTLNEFNKLLDEALKERLIITWSSSRKEKNQRDRERLYQKAQEAVKLGKACLTKRGYMKYISTDMGTPKLDPSRLAVEAQWDGYFGIQTNNKDLTGSDVSGYYHMLWKVEESFRLFKTHLEARPIYHRVDVRIHGHLVLCFLALVLERHLEVRLTQNKIDYSTERIREAITSLQASKIEIDGEVFYLRSEVSGLGEDILNVLNIKIPNNITGEQGFKYVR